VSETPSIHHSSLQEVHEECLCRGEKPDDRQLPSSWPRFQRLSVDFSLSNLAIIHVVTDIDAPPSNESTLYDLIANITLESVAGTTRDKENTMWKVHLRAGGAGVDSEKWFMIQDLIVEETRKEMIFLGETVLQVCCHFITEFMGSTLNVSR
jgi:hypothetical protein